MNDFQEGAKYDLGSITLSEEDIIEFAKAFDPLDLHVDKEAAKKTIFKGLIASGPHIFNLIYRREWLPRFGKSVICGMGVSNWKFIKPVYAGQQIEVYLTILAVKPDKDTKGNAVSWLFEFKNEKGEMVQLLQMEVMHKAD
jgi:acyl dehydratase